MAAGRTLSNRFQRLLAMRCPSFEITNASCLVVAPHPDDEVLGCGALIARKVELGAPVYVAYMCQGNHSPDERRFSHEFMTRRRREERESANAVLELCSHNVFEFGCPDAKLKDRSPSARTWLKTTIQQAEARELFIPSAQEPDGIPDHAATNQIVKAALTEMTGAFDIFEYPVWLWREFPFVSPRRYTGRRRIRKFAKAARDFVEFSRHVNCKFPIGSYADKKAAALSAYRSQMDSPFEGLEVGTLRKIDNGNWLSSFFNEYEYFLHYRNDPTG